jgi:steroid delta-isomerase-like uncharacterized protein
MRTVSVVGLLLMLVGGCTAEQDAPDWGPQIQRANDVLLNQGDVQRVPEFFAESYVSHENEGDVVGRDGIAGFVTSLRTAIPDLQVEVEVLATQGNRVAWLRTHRGTHRGDFMGVPASGRSVTWQDIVVTRYEDGLIAEEWGVTGLPAALLSP